MSQEAYNVRKYFSRKVLKALERELRRDKKRITLPPCDDGVVQVINNVHRKTGLRDPQAGEVLEANVIVFKGQRHYEELLQEGREGAYRSVHVGYGQRIGPTLAADELVRHIAEAVRRWNSPGNEEFQTMKDVLLKNAWTLKSVTRILCFGVGRLEAAAADGPPRTDAYPNVSIMQHVAVYELARFIKEHIKTDKCWPSIGIQDPDYSGLEKSILRQNLRMTPVGGYGALGFLVVNENTIVVAHGASTPIREIVFDLAKPAALFVQSKSSETRADPIPVRTKKIMDEKYLESSVVAKDKIFGQNSWYIRTEST